MIFEIREEVTEYQIIIESSISEYHYQKMEKKKATVFVGKTWWWT
jgi:hypothetical protein